MKIRIMLMVGLMLPMVSLAGPENRGAANADEEPVRCEKQHSQCARQCDKEKSLWFFKGDAYQSCAEKCDARRAECLSKETGPSGMGMQDDAEEMGEQMGDAERMGEDMSGQRAGRGNKEAQDEAVEERDDESADDEEMTEDTEEDDKGKKRKRSSRDDDE